VTFVVLLSVSGRSVGPTKSDKWTYIGCYKDDRPRDLTSAHKDTSLVTGMSLERCYDFCSQYNNMYMALQSGNECRCDNNYGRYGRESRDSKCDEECTRDDSQICGGGWSNSIYQIRDEAATTITSKMMPLKTNSQTLTFTALGDWGKEGSAQREVAKAVADWSDKHNSAFVAAIGDNFYEYGVSSVDDSKWKSTWRNIYTYKSLQKPWLVIEGNHDYLMGNAANQVMYGKKDSRWVMPSLYYSLHYSVGGQDVHMIFLDTDPIRRGYEYHQFNWFQNELEKSTSDWIIVVGHHPVFSSGSHGKESSTRTMYDNIRGLMVKHNVALYICGHDHMMEHITDKTGIVEYVVSGSAAKRTSSKSSSAQDNMKKKSAKSNFWRSDYGFTGFELRSNKIKVSHVNRDGTQVYSFTKENPRKSSSAVIG